MQKLDLDKLLVSHDLNGAVIAIDNYICELCEWGERLDTLSDEQKAFYFNQELEREVNNGGFRLYFSNSSGSYSNATIESLSRINAVNTVKLLQKAINQFPDRNIPALVDERLALIEKLWPQSNEVWDDLDEKFYQYEDKLNELNIAFVRANREYF